MSTSNTVLCVAAHPDDEILGCGATLAKHVSSGDVVHILIMAEGETSRQSSRDREAIREQLSHLTQCAKNASSSIGVSSVKVLSLPDNRLDSLDLLDLVKLVEEFVYRLKPSIVYTHHSGDVNVDHRLIHHAVVTACRPQPGHPVKSLFSFEVPSSTEWQVPGTAQSFSPNHFVDISNFLEAKIKALHFYSSEMRTWPHPRSYTAVEHLARYRGSQVGLEAAEAFSLLRSIQ